ncbi:AcrR Transcriptional regulator [Candidatus Nanopelagicaceae bacterium]
MFVPTRKKPTPPNAGRKSAYVARNRAALLRASQRVLAEIGPEASIDQFAEAAEVSVSTIYKHFENKEALIEAANLGAFHDWEEWADAFVKETEDPLEELILPMRLFLRLKKTHPLYAAMSARNLADLPKYFHGTEEGLVEHIDELMKKKIIEIESPAIRIRSISACILAGLADQLLNPAAKESDADATVEVILSILGISPAKAKKLAHGPMPDLTK